MKIAEQFKPQKIILFGSYAYGKPNEESDVDLMILMRRVKADRALDVRMAIKFDFPVDVLVRSTAVFERRIAMGDFFLMDIKEKGKVLYETTDQGMGRKSRRRLPIRKARPNRRLKTP